MTCNNSTDDIKDNNYSIKTLNMISNRISKLEQDVNTIKNKENNKLSIENNTSLIFDKNPMIKSDLEYKFKNKNTLSQKNLVKNELYNNFDKLNIKYNANNNNTCSNNNHKYKKKINKSQIYKKISNYHNLINERKNILFKKNTQLHKRINTINSFKDISKISLSKNFEAYKNIKNIFNSNYFNKHKNYNNINAKNKLKNKQLDKIEHFMSLDKLRIYDNDMMKVLNDDNNSGRNNNIERLEYEFEIRNLRKRKKNLKHTNIEMIEKLNKIKNKNIKLEKNIFKKEKHIKNIMNNLILLNKNYIIQNNTNELESIETNTNISNTDDDFSLKNTILNIMDIKLDYENYILYKNFYEGLNEMLNLNLSNNNKQNNNDLIMKKIMELINAKNNLEKYNDKYTNTLKENNKYFVYFKDLLNDLNLDTIKNLDEFIHILFIKNIKQNENMKQIKKALVYKNNTFNKNNLGKEKEILKDIIGSQYNLSNQSINQAIFKNYRKNNYYKLHNLYFDKNANPKIKLKKFNNSNYIKIEDENLKHPQKLLSRTIKNENTLDNNTYQNNYSKLLNEIGKENNSNNYYSTYKKYKLNISEDNKNNEKNNSIIKKKYYNGINKIYNRYIHKNNNFNNKDIIKFLSDDEDN